MTCIVPVHLLQTFSNLDFTRNYERTSEIFVPCRGWGVVTCKTHLIALFTAYHCYTYLNDQISMPPYFYLKNGFKISCTPKWQHKGIHVPPNRNISGYAGLLRCQIMSLQVFSVTFFLALSIIMEFTSKSH